MVSGKYRDFCRDLALEYFLEGARVMAFGTARPAVVVCDYARGEHRGHSRNYLSFWYCQVKVGGII